MKKNIIFLIILAVAACKTPKMNKKTPSSPKTVIVTPPPPLEEDPKVADESPVPFFYAITDDGAILEILQGMDASLDVKLVAMGETILNDNLKQIDDTQEEYVTDKMAKKTAKLTLSKEICTDSKEKKYQTKFTLVVGKKTYQGCGNRFVDLPNYLSGKYYLLAIKDKEMENFEQNEINIDVFRNQVNAYFGCNRLGGSFVADQQKAEFFNIFSTMMYCDRKMEWEDYFKNITPSIISYKNNDYGIIFYDKEGKKVMELKRR